MTKGTVTFRVERPVEEVFDYVANLENAPKWVPDLVSVKKTSEGELGVGTRYHEVVRMGNREGTATLEVTEFERPHRFAHTGQGGPSRFSAYFTFEPDGDGTQVTHDYAIQFSGLARLMGPIIGRWVKKNSRDAVERLQAELEGESGRPG